MGSKMSAPAQSCCEAMQQIGSSSSHRHHKKKKKEEMLAKDDPVSIQVKGPDPTNDIVPIVDPVTEIPPEFGDEKRKVVRESWVLVENHIAQIGLSMYLELFQRSPETITLFPFLKHLSKEDLEFYSQLKHHAVRVTGVITMLVRQLDKPREEADALISEFLLDLGRRHFSYGSSPHHMELLGVLFIDCFIHIFDGEPVKQASIQEAWVSFFKFIVFFMSSGFRFVQSKGNAVALT